MKPCSCFAAVCIAQLVGCASIVNGQNQSISVETRSGEKLSLVTGATCRLSNNKGTWFVTTPGSTTVQRSYEELGVTCEKEALEPGLASVKSTTKAMAFGNILFGGIIGAGVDIGTGAAYDYPSLITVIMGESHTIATPPPAGVSDPVLQDPATESKAPPVGLPSTGALSESGEPKATALR
ncbi:hypothetical protein [Propionivibrio sp.]|uniref:hypothetical protein n=1 Tax=Propionivibrio sp. TaxID=2212460 RepID=UPI0025FA8D96|nr:hypothetical protein [Propionivibrio sp.]